MQEALLALTDYWTSRGAMIVQPMNTEVGAGTANPATFLRVLGPEPWRVAYVEPSVRPDDARYGENPNRIQCHTQYQVILKPEPGDPQQQYLGSLEVLGVDLRAHDVRFVEDNWAQPAIGAWGLGWEVWLDGMEITQFTYFQAVGGQTLDPIPVELTYGMERIMMALQGVGHFKEIAYAPGISYGEAFGQAEYEMSRYYLDDADVATNRALFELYAVEARRMVDAGLPVPAHVYVLKCSHAFNVLDARGAVSTVDRAAAFNVMRTLARDVAELWTAKRAELGHPLGLPTPSQPPPLAATGVVPTQPAPLVFEIGVEEMPPHECGNTVAAVRSALTAALAGTGLAHGAITVDATPRRVVAMVADVASREADSRRVVKGPKVAAAYDAEGNLTKAAAGFARGQGVAEAALERITIDGVEYVGVSTEVVGRPAIEVLAEILPGIITGLRSEKNMRWNAPGLSFTRPIRWILALLGEAVVPFQVSNLSSGRQTCVPRTAEHPSLEAASAQAYPDSLAGAGIVLDTAVRRAEIVTGPPNLAAAVGGRCRCRGRVRRGRRGHQPGRVAEPAAGLVRRALPGTALGHPGDGDAQAPALPPGAVRRRCAAQPLRRGGQRGVRRRPGPGRERGGPARPLRGRRVLLAGGPAGAARGVPRPPGQPGVRRQARLDGRPGLADPGDRARPGCAGGADRRTGRDTATGGGVGEVRPGHRDGRRTVQAGRGHGPRVRGASGGDPGGRRRAARDGDAALGRCPVAEVHARRDPRRRRPVGPVGRAVRHRR